VNKQLIHGVHNLRPEHRSSVATIGSFDGVHKGHQAILTQVKAEAGRLNLPSVVMIFEPQPQEYFLKRQGILDEAPARLMRLREKVEALFAQGIDRVLCVPFNQALRRLSADQFVEQILIDGLGVKSLVIGDDFRFGCDRSGDYQMLKTAGAKFDFIVTDTCTVDMDSERISSTRIRAELEANHFQKAAQLLGKPYTITGRVVYGLQLGRQLGVPTANVLLKRYRAPISGVFAVEALVNGERIQGVANVGVRPTLGDRIKPVLEVHLLDWSGDIYGRQIAVEFIHKIRDEKKFNSLEALKSNIKQDMRVAREYFIAFKRLPLNREIKSQ
jgi:riboflavin kinase/FMN adenylyltransferase